MPPPSTLFMRGHGVAVLALRRDAQRAQGDVILLRLLELVEEPALRFLRVRLADERLAGWQTGELSPRPSAQTKSGIQLSRAHYHEDVGRVVGAVVESS